MFIPVHEKEIKLEQRAIQFKGGNEEIMIDNS